MFCWLKVKKASMINESFCGDGLNGGGIGARYPLERQSSWDSNSVLGTSLITTIQNNATVAVIGTADGRLLKVIAQSSLDYNENELTTRNKSIAP